MAVKRTGRATGGRGVSEEATRHLAEIAREGSLSAASLRIVHRGERVASARVGSRRVDVAAPLGADDLFDAASLTKPFVATLALRLDSGGGLPLDTPIGEVLPEARPALARRTLESLLRHRAGLAPWFPLETIDRGVRGVRGVRGRAGDRGERWLRWLAREAPLGAPPGTYSDLGYLAWGLLAERVSGERLSDLLRREVTRPLGISAQATAAPTASRAVECELDGRREVALAAALGVRVSRPRKTFRGEPQDSNARRLARLAGHAGLFVTPEALLALALAWLRPETWLGAGAVQRALGGPRGGYAIGWARRSRAGSSGLALSPRSFGHTGFTGGSLWVDPERELAVALTAHRRSTAIDLNPLRRDLHAWAVERWGRAGGGRSATGVR